RLPRNVAAIYLRPLRRTPTHGLPVCDLQLRSFSVRQLTLAADFAMRAAYYLHLPAKGPVPLPRITERWTVPRSNFVHKKSQENFERVTVRRLVQIQDGDGEVVKAWLGFLMKYCVSGVGMKANLWEYEGVGERKGVEEMVKEAEQGMEGRWNLFGR
ncbi:ribosomal protein S10, partial [Viridothelium virens]